MNDEDVVRSLEGHISLSLTRVPWMRRIRYVLPVPIKRILIHYYWACKQFVEDLQVYSAELVGDVPSHVFRLWWYRHVCGLRIGKYSSIHRRCRLYAPWRITIGDHCVVNYGVVLDGRCGLVIGNNVSISEGTIILTMSHDIDAPDFALNGGPVSIGDRVFIGSHACVLPGVSLGEGAAVGAGSVVVRDVEPFSVVVGTPAQYVRKRKRNLIYELNYRKRFG